VDSVFAVPLISPGDPDAVLELMAAEPHALYERCGFIRGRSDQQAL